MLQVFLTSAIALNLISRLLYLFFIGPRVYRQNRTPLQPEVSWRRFLRQSRWILTLDALSLVAICLLSVGTAPPILSSATYVTVGLSFVILGISTKVLARNVIGQEGYYWYNSYCRPSEAQFERRGIYRFIRNPMYTLGYFHVIGFPLLTQSLPGLYVGLFDWLVIWVFYFFFERRQDNFLKYQTPLLEEAS